MSKLKDSIHDIILGEKISDNIYVDNNGQLICENVVLARTGNYDYREDELLENGSPEKIVQVYRSPEEVFDEESIKSMNYKPLVDEHPEDNVTPETVGELQKGFMTNVRRGVGEFSNCLMADLVITDPYVIDLVRSGKKRELSVGYTADILEENGQYVMKNIRGNHIALCEAGRAGNARIRDSKTVNDSFYVIMNRARDVRICSDLQEAKKSQQNSAMYKGCDIYEVKSNIELYKSLMAKFGQGDVRDELFGDIRRGRATLVDAGGYEVWIFEKGNPFKGHALDVFETVQEARNYINKGDWKKSLRNPSDTVEIVKNGTVIDSNTVVEAKGSFNSLEELKKHYAGATVNKADGKCEVTLKNGVKLLYSCLDGDKDGKLLFIRKLNDNNTKVDKVKEGELKDASPITILKVPYKNKLYTVLEAVWEGQDPNEPHHWLIVRNSNYRGEKRYLGGGIVEFSLSEAKRLADYFARQNIKESDYGITDADYLESLREMIRYEKPNTKAELRKVYNEWAAKEHHGAGYQDEFLKMCKEFNIEDAKLPDPADEKELDRTHFIPDGDIEEEVNEELEQIYKDSLRPFRVSVGGRKFDTMATSFADAVKKVRSRLQEKDAELIAKNKELTGSINDVYPNEGESKEDFISRFMSETKEEYPDKDQRLAVAYAYWKKGVKDSAIKDSSFAILHPTRNEFLSVGGRSWVKEDSKNIQKFSSYDEAKKFGEKYVDHQFRIFKFFDAKLKDSKVAIPRSVALRLDDIETDPHWYESRYNLDFDLQDHYLIVSGNKSNIKGFLEDFNMSEYKYEIRDSKFSDAKVYYEDLRRFCIENNYYTRGTVKDYDNLLMNCDKWSLYEIASDIAQHSNGVWSTEVLAKLRKKFKDSLHVIDHDVEETTEDVANAPKSFQLREYVGNLIDDEVEAVQGYDETLLRTDLDEETRKTLEEIRNDELDHTDKLNAIYKSLTKDPKPVEDDMYGLVKEPEFRYFMVTVLEKSAKWGDEELNYFVRAKDESEARKKVGGNVVRIVEGNHSEYLKFKRNGQVVDAGMVGYLFPKLNEQDMIEAQKYNLGAGAKNPFKGKAEGTFLLGSMKNVRKFAEEYLDYKLNKDYLVEGESLIK